MNAPLIIFSSYMSELRAVNIKRKLQKHTEPKWQIYNRTETISDRNAMRCDCFEPCTTLYLCLYFHLAERQKRARFFLVLFSLSVKPRLQRVPTRNVYTFREHHNNGLSQRGKTLLRIARNQKYYAFISKR